MTEHNNIEILLVEDREEDIDLTLRALKKDHFVSKIKVIKDGEKALEFIFAKGEYSDRDVFDLPKLIILDLKLPKVDGLEVLRKIRLDKMTKLLPVVILTSSSEESDIYESYELGADGYIVKPVKFDNFVKAVADIGSYWMLSHKPLGSN